MTYNVFGGTLKLAQSIKAFSALIKRPQLSLSSDRQHLRYDGCLEVRGKIVRTVLCCVVY